MLPCMPAFALKRYAEVAAGREVFQECYGKHSMRFAHYNVPNVEVTRWYEDEPGQQLDRGRPRENIGLKHPDDPTVWCVLRAGHEITVIYDAKKNSVTFVNMKGVFSLHGASADLARWATEAERVLPFTGDLLMRHLNNAFYLPAASPRKFEEQKSQLVDRDDFEYELVVEPPHDAGDSGAQLDSGQIKSHAVGSSQPPPEVYDIFDHGSRRLNARSLAASNVRSSPADKRGDSLIFNVERAKVVHEAGVPDLEITPSMDGVSDQELLELHVFETKIQVIKVKQIAGHSHAAATMYVSDALFKPSLDSKRCDILHRNSASYARKKNDSYSHGGVKSIYVTFKDAGACSAFVTAVQEESRKNKRVIESKQTFAIDDSQQTHQVDSSSEDAFDDKDSEFEPVKAVKRKSTRNATSTSQLHKRPGNAAEASCVSLKYAKYVINPKIMAKEMRDFLERCEVPMDTYEQVSKELPVSHAGSVIINEECGFSLSRTNPGGKGQAVPTEFTWGDIRCIKSFRSRTEEKPGERVICFQSENGLVHTFIIDGLAGDYSRFRTIVEPRLKHLLRTKYDVE